jgi:hypothetical protein
MCLTLGIPPFNDFALSIAEEEGGGSARKRSGVSPYIKAEY